MGSSAYRLRPGVPALVLAPMEGVTDAPMREVLTALGGFDHSVAEFIRVSRYIPPKKTFLDYVPELKQGSRTSSGVPVQVQLLGGDPELLAQSALRAIEAGACGIDLNFGCPAPTVNRHDGGATLLKYPDRIEAIVRAVRQAVPTEYPVSAKLRLGWDDPKDLMRNAERAARGGASWLTVHGRTRMQGYQPPALWEPIGELRRALEGSGIPVVANGDLWSREDYLRCRDVTGCEHFMFGRGAVADPWMVESLKSGREIVARDWLDIFAQFARGWPVASRLKQWARMVRAIHPEFLPALQFESMKTAQTVEEVLQCLSKPGREYENSDVDFALGVSGLNDFTGRASA